MARVTRAVLLSNMSWLSSKSQKQDTVFCPVCELPRNKGDHTKCSRITQQKCLDEKNNKLMRGRD